MRFFSYGLTQKALGLTVVISVFIASLAALTVGFFIHNLFFSTFIFILVLLVGWFVNYAKPVVWAFIDGEDGEAAVARELKKLPPDFYVLHDFTEGQRGNIDFVVVSPTGIWTLEVKNYGKGDITFENGVLKRNGYPIIKNPLSQAYAEAMGLQNFINQSLGLSLPVNPVLVFANPKDKVRFGLKEIHGVQVIGIQWIMKLLQEPNMPIRLTPEQCIAVRNEMKKNTSLI